MRISREGNAIQSKELYIVYDLRISLCSSIYTRIYVYIYIYTRERRGGAVSVTIVSKKNRSSNHKDFKSATRILFIFPRILDS